MQREALFPYLFISYIDKLVPTFSVISLGDLESLCRSEEGSELVVPVVARIEVRLLLLDESADISEKCPSIIIGEVRYRIGDEVENPGRGGGDLSAGADDALSTTIIS